MPKEAYYKEVNNRHHLNYWFSYVSFYLFIFSNFELFCVCFNFQFWLLYLICECVYSFQLDYH